MAVDILRNEDDSLAVLYCNTSDWAFGPVFGNGDRSGASEKAEDFLDWLPLDPPREPNESDLERQYVTWILERTDDNGDLKTKPEPSELRLPIPRAKADEGLLDNDPDV